MAWMSSLAIANLGFNVANVFTFKIHCGQIAVSSKKFSQSERAIRPKPDREAKPDLFRQRH
jgi:hypothetical protein